jgi:hypothetical protein
VEEEVHLILKPPVEEVVNYLVSFLEVVEEEEESSFLEEEVAVGVVNF